MLTRTILIASLLLSFGEFSTAAEPPASQSPILKAQARCYDSEARAQCKARCSDNLKDCKLPSSSCEARYSQCISGCPPQVCTSR